MKHRRIIHADLDAFFASVEQRDRPELRGKPMVVGGRPEQRGVVSAASYEARAFGIHAAMPLRQAHRFCSQATFLPGDFPKYRAVSAQVHQILQSYTPLVEPLSLDEAFLDVTGCQALFGDALEVAKAIRRRVKEEVGLTISIGLATNKTVAKIACSLGKPDGLVVVPPGEEKGFLAPLPIRELGGVGPRTAEKLQHCGVTTIGQLAARPVEQMEGLLGESGRWLHQLANGIDLRPVSPPQPAKSMGHETTFPQDVYQAEQVKRELLDIAHVVGARLREGGYRGRVVTLKLRYPDFVTITRRKTLPDYTASSKAISKAALELFQKESRRGWRLVGISVSDFGPQAAEQLSLFDQQARRTLELERVIDELRHRFGEKILILARLLKA